MAVDLLRRLDLHRQQAGQSSLQGRLTKQYSGNGQECTVVYSHCTPGEIGKVIRKEISLAERAKYTLEWKVYGHDSPANLKEHLLLAGFSPGPVESLMALRLSPKALRAFQSPDYEIRAIRDPKHLIDVASISREIGRTNVEEERKRLALSLQVNPEQMSVYVAFIDSEPVACGRIYFDEESKIAELSGGRTKTTRRKQGLYTALVRARLKEAITRGCKYVFVDALPTSEPILKKRGFEFLIHTQPFVYRPKSLGTRKE
jgi:hypothetical protein